VSADLAVNLESPLPAGLPAGRATALFCSGTCVHRGGRVTAVELLVDGVRRPVDASRMPRPDVLAATGHLRSGWWGTAPVPAGRPGEAVELALAVRLAGGQEERAQLARLAVGDGGAAGAGADPDLIAVCMATFEPDLELFRAQVESLRAQAGARWSCVISDDGSSEASVAAMEGVLGGDERFSLSRSERRLGFYRNFERAIRLAPPEAGLLALCDQDDRWAPDKLAVLRDALGSAGMAYSDQRLVTPDGRVLRETMWRGRRNNHTDLTSMLVANSITGAAVLMRRDVAELALPFPDTPGLQFHDHWLALVALAAGEIAYVDRPLYDYVQHPGAVFGDVTSTEGPRRSRLRDLGRGGRGAYFLGYEARAVQAHVLLARCGARLAPAKRRALRRYLAAERSPLALAWLALRSLRVLAGRTETLGSEAELARGVVWRRLVALLCTGAGARRRPLCDASFPDPLAFEQKRLRRWRARA
jgi:hypothetical protein